MKILVSIFCIFFIRYKNIVFNGKGGSISNFIQRSLLVLSWYNLYFKRGFPGGASGEEPACVAGDMRLGFDSWVGSIPWSRKWQPTPVFLSWEIPCTRSLEGYSPWCLKELD